MPRSRYKFSKCWSALKRPFFSFFGAIYRFCNLFWCFCCTCFDGLRKFLKLIWHGFATYFHEGYMTGTRYLVQPNYHFTERIFWALCIVSSFLLSVALIMHYLSTYSTDVYRIVVENRDINLPLQFPAIGVCEYQPLDRTVNFNELVENITKRYGFKTRRESSHIKRMLNIMTYQDRNIENELTFTMELAKKNRLLYKNMFDDIDFESVADKLRGTCKEMFHECTWKTKLFDCCAYFREIKTMLGKCFLWNSLQTDSDKKLDTFVTRNSGKKELKIILNKDVMVYLLNPTDIPEIVSPLPLRHQLGHSQYKDIVFTLHTVVIDPELYAYNRNTTKCFNGNEKYLDWNQLMPSTYKHVSFSTCLTDCIRYLQLKECGCINYSFYKTKKENYCDLKGYMCLEKKGLFYLRSLIPLKHTICGQCYPACDSAFIEIINWQHDNVRNMKATAVFKLLTFPTKQYRRQVTRGNLDIVVSFGGIFSLFLGVSMVSLIEFIFVFSRAMLQY